MIEKLTIILAVFSALIFAYVLVIMVQMSAINQKIDAILIRLANTQMNKQFRELLDQIEAYAMEHCDEEADVQNTKPKDMEAHRNGLIVQLCRRGRKLLNGNESHNDD